MKRKLIILLAAAFLITSIGTFLPVSKAQACCSCKKEVQKGLERNWWEWASSTVKVMVSFFEGEFTTHKLFIAGMMWEDNILPSMMLMTEQLNSVAMQQMQIVGGYFDAENQLETQQLFQMEQAKIRKAYQPSQGVCEFGTSMKSLAASDRRSEITAVSLSERAIDRQAGNAFSSAYDGPTSDKESRVVQFAKKFCDVNDNNGGLDLLCDDLEDTPQRRNKDIDYARTLDDPWTLNVDFTDNELTNNEEEILALGSYLFGHQVFARAPSVSLRPEGNGLSGMQKKYMDARALMAKQSVARNSYNALAAAKSAGTPGSREFLVNILKELGVESVDDIKTMLGDDENDPTKKQVEPSYNAQMEILTKKLYQNPDFYTNLYDTPANVDRKTVALQAIGLMQKFDVFKSYLRQEAAVSTLLEMAVSDMQGDVENDLGRNEQ
ncbi:MAG: hypothetical protein KDJ35_04565 [Alphaproteobacteria bacterium]|nr:hypothetical protein [Alphaproteobacteria bacterium]